MSATDLGGSAFAGQQSPNPEGFADQPTASGSAALALRPGRASVFAALILALLLGSAGVVAAPATYSGESPVTSQSEAERSEALKTALAAVVMRLSGDPGILADGNVAAAVAQADKYVLQYRYQRGMTSADAEGNTSPSLVLVAEFDSVAVDRMLAGLGLGSGSAAVAIDTTPSEQQIWLSGIHSAQDYARGLGYLSKHSLVRQSWPVEARGDGLLVRLSLSGGLQRWLDIVDGEGVLRVNSASPPLEGIDATLVLNP